MDTRLAIFKGKSIRKTIHQKEWWFSVIDVVDVLTGSDRPRKYWSDLKKKLLDEGYSEVSEKIGQLKLQAPGGDIAGGARKKLEKRLGRSLVSQNNYLKKSESQKSLDNNNS